MRREHMRQILSGHNTEAVDTAFAAAQKTVAKPKGKTHTERSSGVYNSVALPEVPAYVTDVRDAGKQKPGWHVTGQQVVADRPFEPPVEVEYVTRDEVRRYQERLTAETRKRVE